MTIGMNPYTGKPRKRKSCWRCDVLKRKCNLLQEEVKELEKKFIECGEERDMLTQACVDLRIEERFVRNKWDEWEQAAREAVQLAHRERERAKTAEAALTECQEKLAIKRGTAQAHEFLRLHKQIEGLKRALGFAHSELAECQENLKSESHKVALAMDREQESDVQISRLKRELAECRGAYDDVEGELESLTEDYSRLLKKLAAAEAQVEVLERELAECREQLELVKDDLDGTIEKAMANRRRTEKAEAELAECQEKLATLEAADRQWDKTSLVEIVTERNELREKLAAAEARLKQAEELIKGQEWNAMVDEAAERVIAEAE